MFQQGDLVNYVGEKFASEIRSKLGEVVARVKNEPGAYVVDFGDDAYIVGERSLTRFKASNKSEPMPKVQRRRRDDEE